MCGILCLLSLDLNIPHIVEEYKRILKNRGPDVQNCVYECNDLIAFFGFVLWQQGEQVFSQPAVSEKYVLLLNGDIYNANKPLLMSDTEWLSLELQKCETENSIIELIRSLKGPYSIIFYDKQLKLLYFARDPLGRNSLVVERDFSNNLIKIASTSNFSNKKNIPAELPPVGLYKLHIEYESNNACLNLKNFELFSWKFISPDQKESIESIFQKPLIESVVPENPHGIRLEMLNNRKYFNFYEKVQNLNTNVTDKMVELLKDEEIALCVEDVINLLKFSLKDRILNTPNFCVACIKESRMCNHSKIGILFSGGLDCSILAKLSNDFCNKSDSIDLINVAFENVNSKNEQQIDWYTPDRITGLKSFKELKELMPERKWNFVEVNVTRKELDLYLSKTIKHLIYPLNTVLDESLGASFWFASRGKGVLESELYQTTCRVILLGSGADEMFGGYTRHRNAFVRTQGEFSTKINAVRKELKTDWDRIAFRNLGRDDRVIADNGKTARAPYIEENFVSYINNLEPEQKCCFILGQGIGEKLLLRLCGLKLNLRYSSTLQKRAIQFGSKIADKKQNATDISKYLLHLEN
ncbi:asparagine synthetase domain-containing protein CG17486 [Condylostylus longicornis]|uniref:asparagine synthetase domain-containing protein CG17486 n=1 Tax=Condylostylus longicornis TaxID=2530218 RepID=UPI00244E20F5|nr:asparagine synthetase domain-containing protein CG17486 [Condylostylus longicornis]